jgi:heme exporter protein A
MNTTRYTLAAEGITKKFNAAPLFRDLSFTAETGKSLCVTGPNGSGKSTLLKIVAGIQDPTRGSVTYSGKTVIEKPDWARHMGYTGPLINPYDDLTAMENIHFAGTGASRTDVLLSDFNLTAHRDKKVRHFSSGMKQRLKIIIAIMKDPPVLVLDEPGMNLDAAGKDALYAYLEKARSGKIIIIATNEPAEEKLCGGVIRLG